MRKRHPTEASSGEAHYIPPSDKGETCARVSLVVTGPRPRSLRGRQGIEVIIEIPKGTRNKYEYDHERHVIFLDRRLFSATVYPADYGFVPGTLAEDGDPLDVLVLTDEPTFPGCHILARPIGVFQMTDEHGPDAKVIAVPAGDPRMSAIEDLAQLPEAMTAEIAHFFEVYKELEPGKQSEVGGFQGRLEAWEEIERSSRRAKDHHRDTSGST